LISLVTCALSATAHYRKSAWGDPWQPIAWLFSMLFFRFGSKRPKIVAAFCCRLNALNQLFGKGKAEPGFALKLEQSY